MTTVKSLAAAIKGRWVAAANRPNRGAPSLWFWVIFLTQTLRGRDLLPLSREMRDSYQAEGLEHLPPGGVFTLAVNHTMRRWTPRVLASIHQATIEQRPDLARDWLVIVGYKEARLEGRPRSVQWLILQIRRLHTGVYQRWTHNVLRLPMGNDRASVQALREWKKRAQRQPTIVFPEGRGYPTFEEVRPGAGRWLGALDVPVLPASVWWNEQAAQWHIVFGPCIEWSVNPRLHDLQIGLEIAERLPPTHAPLWQDDLEHWRAAFEDEVDESVGTTFETAALEATEATLA